MRHLMLASSLFAVAALASAEAGNKATGPTGPSQKLEIQAVALDKTPESRLEANRALDGAVAAAVIGAVAQEFGEREVGVKLDTVKVDPSSIRDRAVSGEGRLKLGDDAEWITFRYAAQYDTEAELVTAPQLVIGASGAGRAMDANAPVSRSLERSVVTAMQGEFAGQPVKVAFDRVRVIEAGARYQRVEAIGLADFGSEGTAAASAQGLYDTRAQTWVKVNYELGSTANWAETQVATL